jgi:hypothetical protein
MLAGYFRPFWYARGQALSFLLEDSNEPQCVFTPLLDYLGGPLSGREDPSRGLIVENWTGSGVINDPKSFLAWFDKQEFGDHFDNEGLEAVRKCAGYSIKNNCQMIEVADVYSPFAGTCTFEEHARAHHLENVDEP